MYICSSYVCLVPAKYRSEDAGSLELEVPTVMSCPVCAGSQSSVLWRSSESY